jgi:uncharacterized membrane protein (DUF441 family)
MNSFVTSLIRTYVPIGVGAVIAWLATLGLQLDAETQTSLVIALTGIIQAAYYFIARWIEKRFPQIGTILLGSSKAPVYREKS